MSTLFIYTFLQYQSVNLLRILRKNAKNYEYCKSNLSKEQNSNINIQVLGLVINVTSDDCWENDLKHRLQLWDFFPFEIFNDISDYLSCLMI